MRASAFISLAMLVLLSSWLLFGARLTGASSNTEDSEEKTLSEKSFATDSVDFTVLTRESRSQKRDQIATFNGFTQIRQKVSVKLEIDGTIKDIMVDVGDTIRKGQMIATLIDEGQQVRLLEAQAQLEKAQQDQEANASIASKGFASRLSTLDANLALRTAQAKVEKAEQELQSLQIKAPFDGVISQRDAEAGQVLRIGNSIATILNLNPIDVSFYVPESHYQLLSIGTTISTVINNAIRKQGVVRYISPVANEQTLTYEVLASIDNSNGLIPSGMSAITELPISGVTAHLLDYSSLTLDERGNLIVRTIEDGSVKDVPVRILRDGPSGKVWLQGLPEIANVIVAGQDFVLDGQKVQWESESSEEENLDG